MNRLTNLILLLILITSSVFASTTGKIRGTIIDAESGEPLVGANIILKGTTLGAATNLNTTT